MRLVLPDFCMNATLAIRQALGTQFSLKHYLNIFFNQGMMRFTAFCRIVGKIPSGPEDFYCSKLPKAHSSYLQVTIPASVASIIILTGLILSISEHPGKWVSSSRFSDHRLLSAQWPALLLMRQSIVGCFESTDHNPAMSAVFSMSLQKLLQELLFAARIALL